MKRFLHLSVVGLALFTAKLSLAQTATFTIGMGQVSSTHASLAISPTSLFQLVNLGANGLFDSIEAGAWVSGDDSLIDLPFPNSDNWANAAAFDASDGAGEAGVFLRQFTFTLGPALPSGATIGIRWFPTILAAQFGTTTTTVGLPYGQFTQLVETLYEGTTLWVVPGAGSAVDFDQMLTPSYDPQGLNPNSAGVASFSVVPEPNIVSLISFFSLVSLMFWLKRSTFG